MARYQACIDAIQEAAGGVLKDEDIDAIVSDIERRKRRILREKPMQGDQDAALEAARELGDEKKLAAIIEKRSRAINVLRKQANIRFIDSQFAGRESRGMQALTVGIEGKEQGAALSQDAQAKGIGLGYVGALTNELRQHGVLGMLAENAIIRAGQMIGLFRGRIPQFRQLERNVAQELWNLGEPERAIETNDATAKTIAQIVNRYQELARTQQNDAGAWIRKLPGYIVRQSHDQLKIRGKGETADFVRWRDFIAPRLDERTFDDVPDGDRDKFLGGVWSALSTGVHETPGGDWLGGFKGPGNLAKRASAERVLHFKSAMDWFDYNERFGHGSLLEAMLQGFMAAGRNVAALRTWGTNPEAAFDRLRAEMAQKATDRRDLREADRINGKGIHGDYLKRQFQAANGWLGIPESPTLARLGANVRALTGMAKLGGVVVSSFPDVANAAAVLKHNGYGVLERWQNAIFGTVLRGPLDAEARQASDLWGTALDGILGSIVARYSAADHFAGKITKLQDVFFRVNGLGFWTDRMKEGVSLALARRMAMDAGRSFDTLDPRLQVTLGRYKIDAPTWDLIRKGVAASEDGRSYILPDVAERLPDEDLRAWAGLPEDADAKALDRARFELTSRLRSYFVEQSREALTEPGAKERAAITMGTRPGTWAGEFLRSFTLFRTFSYTFITRNLGREIYRSPDKVGAAIGAASLIAGTTILGALSNAAADLAKGRTPRDPRENPWGVATAALLKGGGAGLFGDFLLGTSNRFGQSLGEQIPGPIFGQISDIKKIIDASVGNIAGQPQGAAVPMALRYVLGNTPFLNLFYTRTAFDYLIGYQLMEMANPGYLRRYERQVQRENNQRFLISPSSAIPYGGGSRLFEGVR